MGKESFLLGTTNPHSHHSQDPRNDEEASAEDEAALALMRCNNSNSNGNSNGNGNSNSNSNITTSALASVASIPDFFLTSLQHLKDALRMIPKAVKKDFDAAVKANPQLVLQESNPWNFLRTADFNPWQAAKRWVLHWEYRKWLFGQERWLKPLFNTQTSSQRNTTPLATDGALTATDLHLLNTGWIAYATPTDAAQHGRFLLVDHGRYQGHALDAFLRVLFYLCTAATDPVAQTVGLTSVRLVSTKDPTTGGPAEPPLSMALMQTSQTAYKMMKQALPVRLTRVLFLRERDVQAGNVLHIFLSRMGQSVQHALQHPVVTVQVPCTARAAETLQGMGFPSAALPDNHGGAWNYDRLLEWRQQIATTSATTTSSDMPMNIPVEWLQEAVAPKAATAETNGSDAAAAAAAAASSTTAVVAAAATSTTAATETEDTGPCPNTPVSSSAAVAAVATQEKRVSKEKSKSAPTTIETSAAPAAAATTTVTVSSDIAAATTAAAATPDDDRHKQVHALNARRAYQKRKVKQSETAAQAQMLQAQHDALKQENERLTALWQQAKDVLALLQVEQGGGGGGTAMADVALLVAADGLVDVLDEAILGDFPLG